MVERGLEALHVPGLAVAVVAGDEVVLSRGFGFRDVTAKLPVTPETVFAIGSSTKAMTATLLGTLVDDGVLEWDEAVRSYLPLVAEEEQEAAEDADRVEGTAPSHPLPAYAGEFEHPGYGTLRVTRDEDDLAFSLNGLEGTLEHWHYDVFNAPETPAGSVKVEFLTAVDGRVDRVQAAVEPAVAPIVFTRKPPAELSDPAFLARLAGEYLLMGRTVTVAVRGESLTVAVPGQPTFELLPYEGTEYKVEDLPGYRVRFALEGDRVTGLDFVQPNGTFHAERREP